MELKQYLTLLWRWLWLLLLATLGAAIVALVISILTKPVYAATATVLINQAPHGDLTDPNALVSGQRLAQTYVELLTKRPVLEEALQSTGAVMTTEDLAQAVKVNIVGDTGLITIQVENEDPAMAAKLANTIPAIFAEQNGALQASRYADTLASLSQELTNINTQIQKTQTDINALGTPTTVDDRAELARLQTIFSQLNENHATLLQTYESTRLTEAQTTSNIQIVEPALVPAIPVRPRLLQNTLLAAAVGLMLAIGLVFLVEYLDDSLRSPEQVSQIVDAPVVGVVARMNGHTKSKANGNGRERSLLAAEQPRSPIVEAFRTLRTNIQFSSVDVPVRSLLVTSAGPVEGKSTVSSNLAVVMAQAGLRVVLVDGDLRRPSVHKIFGIANRLGVTDAMLQASAQWDTVAQATQITNLSIIPTGSLPPNPSEILSSDRFRQFLDRLTNLYDMVIVDSPPLLAVTDAAIIGRSTNGVILVVDTGSTRAAALAQAKQQLERVSARLLGVVMNKFAVGRGGYAGYYQYYQYHYYGSGSSNNNGQSPSNGNGQPPVLLKQPAVKASNGSEVA